MENVQEKCIIIKINMVWEKVWNLKLTIKMYIHKTFIKHNNKVKEKETIANCINATMDTHW